MPLVPDDQSQSDFQSFPSGPPAPDPFQQQPGAGETIGAAFRQQNPVVSVIDSLYSMPSMKFDPNHNPRDTLRGTSHEGDDFSIYANSPNEAYTRALMAKGDQEDKDRRTLAASGGAGTAAMVAAGLLDPAYAIPILGEASAARFAATGAAAGIGSEAALQGSQVNRTWQESAGNIASSAILMGALGKAAEMLHPAQLAEASKSLDTVRPMVDAETGLTVPAPAGAAVSDTRQLEPISIGGLQHIPGIGNASPNLRIYFGDSVEAKRAAHDLGETDIRFKPEAGGFGEVPLESQKRILTNQALTATKDIVESNWFDHYWGEKQPNFAAKALAKEGIGAPTIGDRLSLKDFKTAVTKTMSAGDKSDIPEVQAAAQELRAKVYDPWKKMAQETKGPDGQPMLSEELGAPKGAESFVPVIYKRDAMIANAEPTKKAFADWLEKEQAIKAGAQERLKPLVDESEKIAAKIKSVKPEDTSPETLAETARLNDRQRVVREKIKDEATAWKGKSGAKAGASDQAIEDSVKDILGSDQTLSRQELESRAAEWFDRTIGSPDGRLDYDAPIAGGKFMGADGQEVRGSLRERRVAMPYQQLADLGIIHTDIEHITASMLRTLIPDVLLTRKFGDVAMTESFRKINEEFDARVKPGADSTKIYKDRNANIRDLAAMRDRLRGVAGWDPSPMSRSYGQWIRGAQDLNALTSLNSSVINRFIDLGSTAVFRHGLENVFRDQWTPMLQSAMNPELRSLVKSQAKDAGVGVEGLLSHMRQNFADILDSYEPGNKFLRGLAWSADRSMLVNLHGPWTDWLKAFAYNVAQGAFARAAEKVANGTASAADIAKLAHSGIDEAMAVRISKAYEAGHVELNGRKFADAANWTDQSAKLAFQAAMSREANASVLTAGIGEKPLWMDSKLGRMMGQFKSFIAAAHEKILISNIQQRDGRALMGLMTMLGLGALSYRMYTLAAGQEASDNPADWMKEAIHRSAITGWLGEENAILSSLSAGKLDYARLFGATAPLTRRQSMTFAETLGGPTIGKAENVRQAAFDMLSGKTTGQDIHKVREAIIPLQNFMIVRILFDKVEDGFANAVGVKPRQHEGPRYVQ